jgi:hypothetical protein
MLTSSLTLLGAGIILLAFALAVRLAHKGSLR